MADALFAKTSVKVITREIITLLTAAKIAFDNSMVDQGTKVSERSISTTERVAKGNALYAFTVDLADAGKSYWFDKNEAKHGDYLRYDNQRSPVTPTPVP